MDESDWLRPLLSGRLRIGRRKLSGRLTSERRPIGKRRRPPHLRRKVIGGLPDGLNRRGEQQGLGDCTDFWSQSLLPRLRPEGREVRRNHIAGDNLNTRFLKGADLSREIVGQRLKV